MLNTVALILFCLIPDISLTDPIVDVDELETQSAVTLNAKNESIVDVDEFEIMSAETLDAQNESLNMNMALRDSRSKITKEAVEDAFNDSIKILEERSDLEIKLAEMGRVIKKGQRKTDSSLMRVPDQVIHARESVQTPLDEASYILYKKFDLSRDDVNEGLPTVPLDGELSSARRNDCRQMLPTADCNANLRYRTADGQCNNLQNPTWGSTVACQQRLLPAYYEGNSGFRVSVNGEPLPDPRTLSLNLHDHINAPTYYVTHMYMFFGQLLDHDITLTPVSQTVDSQAIECCPPENETHPQCMPIIISENDPFYSRFNLSCMNFVRSASCPTCTLGAKQLMNRVTAFIDASFVYGNSDDETASLRMNDGTGRLRVQESRFGDLLPQSSNPENDSCSFPETDEICFEAGDPRANQHTVLASLHTIFMREHNRIASRLRAMNPHWDEERLFQEARRIVGAEMQTITYKEYLPITLGHDRMEHFHLRMGGRTGFNAEEDPTMITEFTTAAFRFGHSLINSVVSNSPLNATGGLRLLRNEFSQPFDLYRGYAGSLLKGASSSQAQQFDSHLVLDVTNFLLRGRGEQTGLDLASINIHRGRDHGVPTYVDMVNFCSDGNIVIREFDDLTGYNLMRHQQANALRQNYRFVEDIDLWPGILMEIPKEGAVVGPTAACIIGEQFKKLKFGDRFYVEHVHQKGSFSYDQLQELRSTTLSQIICLNTDVSQMPLNAMLFNSRNNPMIDCHDVTEDELLFNSWAEPQLHK